MLRVVDARTQATGQAGPREAQSPSEAVAGTGSDGPPPCAPEADIAALYSNLAADFDQVGPRLFSAFGRALVEFADVRAGERVLDMGCGRGAVLLAAARRVGAAGRAVGIDLSPAMVEHCRADAERAGLRNVAVAAMDAQRLSFATASFDAVLCGFMLFLCPAPERALEQALGVLRPGGRVVISTFPPERDRRWWWLHALIRRHAADQVVQLPCSSEADVGAALRRAGFHDCLTVTRTIDVAYADEEQWLRTFASHGQGQFLAQIAPGQREAFRATAARRLSAAREHDGRIHHRMSALFTRARRPGGSARAATGLGGAPDG